MHQQIGLCPVRSAGQIVEVLPEESDHERQRQEHGAEQRQVLQDLIGAIGDRREVGVQRVAQQIAVGFVCLVLLFLLFVVVVFVVRGSFADQALSALCLFCVCVLLWCENLAQRDQLAHE